MVQAGTRSQIFSCIGLYLSALGTKISEKFVPSTDEYRPVQNLPGTERYRSLQSDLERFMAVRRYAEV